MHQQSLHFADAAVTHFVDAQWLRHEADNMARLACVLYARAGRAALCALLGANDADLSGAASTADLQELLDGLHAQRDPLAKSAIEHARILSVVLVLDKTDAGRDYVTRDLLGAQDVLRCEQAATVFLTACLQRLFSLELDRALWLHGIRGGGVAFRNSLPRWEEPDDD